MAVMVVPRLKPVLEEAPPMWRKLFSDVRDKFSDLINFGQGIKFWLLSILICLFRNN